MGNEVWYIQQIASFHFVQESLARFLHQGGVGRAEVNQLRIMGYNRLYSGALLLGPETLQLLVGQLLGFPLVA
jgi:hypothetical protein